MKKRILVIDDNEDLRRVLKVFLEEAGYEVMEASNNRDGLSKCAHDQPHLIIVDVYLGSELGLDICLTLAKDPSYYGNPKIVVVSGSIGGELVKSAEFKKEYSIDMFVKKPFDFSELVNNVHVLLKEQK